MGFGVSRRNGLGTGDGNGDGDAAYRIISSRMHVSGCSRSSTPHLSPLSTGEGGTVCKICMDAMA
jgi:hypothetical protein